MFFFVNFFSMAFFDKIEVDFFLYCPLPDRLPSGSSANFTKRGALRRVKENPLKMKGTKKESISILLKKSL